MKTNNSIIIVTLYDGYEYDSKLRTGFGFSCLVKIGGKSLLFDTGSESQMGDGRAVIKEFKALGVQKVAPCHCTGDLAIGQFKEEYKDNFIANGVGKIIEI